MAKVSSSSIHGFFPLLIEGDSQILINMVNQILQGTPSYKLVSIWRLVERLEPIKQWLSTDREVTVKHIFRDGNKVADFLANIGADNGWTVHAGSLNIIATASQINDYNALEESEEEHPDVGDHHVIKDDYMEGWWEAWPHGHPHPLLG